MFGDRKTTWSATLMMRLSVLSYEEMQEENMDASGRSRKGVMMQRVMSSRRPSKLW